MNFKKKIIENFDAILNSIQFDTSKTSDNTIGELNLNQLSATLGLKDFTRQDIIDICNAWGGLTKALPENYGRNIYDKLASSGFVNAEKLGYDNVYVVFSTNINVFNYEKCVFRMTHVVGGHLGTDIHMYCQKLFGAVINADEYDAYFESKENAIEFLETIGYTYKNEDGYRQIRGILTFNQLKQDYPTATMLDFDNLAVAVKDAYSELLDNEDLLQVLDGLDYYGEGGKIDEFDARMISYKGEKVLLIEATKVIH